MARRHQKVFDFSWCIYCGGATDATTVDHVPPIAMFDERVRPKGLEFPSCSPCNAGTRKSDLAVSLFGRLYPDINTDARRVELVRLLEGVKKRIPGLLEEMQVPKAKAKFAAERYGKPDGGFLRLSGPLATKHLNLFAAKLAFAFHFHATKKAVPFGGGVVARVFSNIEAIEGAIPDELFGVLVPKTLMQGKINAGSQFRYDARVCDEGTMTMGFASFRRSFAVATFSATSEASIQINGSDPPIVFRPGDLKACDNNSTESFYSIAAAFRMQ